MSFEQVNKFNVVKNIDDIFAVNNCILLKDITIAFKIILIIISLEKQKRNNSKHSLYEYVKQITNTPSGDFIVLSNKNILIFKKKE